MSAHIYPSSAVPIRDMLSPFEQSFGLLFGHCFGLPISPHVDHVGLLDDHVGSLGDHAGPPREACEAVEEHLRDLLRIPLGTLTIVLGP